MNNLTLKEKQYFSNKLFILFKNNNWIKKLKNAVDFFSDEVIGKRFGYNQHADEIGVYDRYNYIKWDQEPSYSCSMIGSKVYVYVYINYKQYELAKFDLFEDYVNYSFFNGDVLNVHLDDLINVVQASIIDIVENDFYDSFYEYQKELKELENCNGDEE